MDGNVYFPNISERLLRNALRTKEAEGLVLSPIPWCNHQAALCLNHVRLANTVQPKLTIVAIV